MTPSGGASSATSLWDSIDWKSTRATYVDFRSVLPRQSGKDAGWVKQCREPGDNTFSRKPSNPFDARRGGQANLTCQFGVADAAICLQGPEYVAINLVKFFHAAPSSINSKKQCVSYNIQAKLL